MTLSCFKGSMFSCIQIELVASIYHQIYLLSLINRCHQFNLNALNHKTCELTLTSGPAARYYPKTSIPMASESHPDGVASVRESFKWPERFMDRMVQQFGEVWLSQRLRSWSWSCSTAFSGVGAPESVCTPMSC